MWRTFGLTKLLWLRQKGHSRLPVLKEAEVNYKDCLPWRGERTHACLCQMPGFSRTWMWTWISFQVALFKQKYTKENQQIQVSATFVLSQSCSRLHSATVSKSLPFPIIPRSLRSRTGYAYLCSFLAPVITPFLKFKLQKILWAMYLFWCNRDGFL